MPGLKSEFRHFFCGTIHATMCGVCYFRIKKRLLKYTNKIDKSLLAILKHLKNVE